MGACREVESSPKTGAKGGGERQYSGLVSKNGVHNQVYESISNSQVADVEIRFNHTVRLKH